MYIYRGKVPKSDEFLPWQLAVHLCLTLLEVVSRESICLTPDTNPTAKRSPAPLTVLHRQDLNLELHFQQVSSHVTSAS